MRHVNKPGYCYVGNISRHGEFYIIRIDGIIRRKTVKILSNCLDAHVTFSWKKVVSLDKWFSKAQSPVEAHTQFIDSMNRWRIELTDEIGELQDKLAEVDSMRDEAIRYGKNCKTLRARRTAP